MFRIISASRFKPKLTFWERLKKIVTFRHPIEYVSWGDLSNDIRSAVCLAVEFAEKDGIDTSEIDLYFSNNGNIGTAYLSDNMIILDRYFLKPGYANAMLFTLLHELRHFDQSRRGLIYVMPQGTTYWMGEIFQQSYTYETHFLAPWELDANAYAESKLTAEQFDFSLYFSIKNAVAKHNVNMVMQY